MNAPAHIASRPPLPNLWDEESEPPKASKDLRQGMRIAAILLVVALLLATFVPIGGAVIGMGQVGVDSRVKRVAHPHGGVIAEIAVRNGDHVKKGALLMRLDDKVTGADATYSSLTVEQLLAQRARLEAERLGASSIVVPPELRNSKSETARKAMADETHLFAMRRNEEQELQAQLQARIDQDRQQIRSYEAQIGALKRQRDLIEPELEGVRKLWEQKLVTINHLNQLERTAADIEGNMAALQAQIAKTRSEITESQAQAIQIGETRRAQAGTQLAQVNATLNDQQLRNVAATDSSDRSEIRAPYSGTVEKLAFFAEGDVIKPADPIMEIVPDEDEMIVEAAISPTDVDQVQVGQKARVRFSSFNRAATPEIPGTVSYVATDNSQGPDGRSSFYIVRVAVDQSAVKAEDLALRSGMPAEVYIQTGNRSMLSYITKPLRDQFARAFRDN